MKTEYQLTILGVLVLLYLISAVLKLNENVLFMVVLLILRVFIFIIVNYKKNEDAKKDAIDVSMANKVFAISNATQPTKQMNIIPIQMFVLPDNTLSLTPASKSGFTNLSFPFNVKIINITLTLDNDKEKKKVISIYDNPKENEEPGKIISILRIDNKDKSIYYHANPEIYKQIKTADFDTKMTSKHPNSYAVFKPVDDKNKNLMINANEDIVFKYMEGAKEGIANCDVKDKENCPSYKIVDGKKVCDCSRTTLKEKLITVYFMVV